MVFLKDTFKILYPVIILDIIDMMYYISFRYLTSPMSLPYLSM